MDYWGTGIVAYQAGCQNRGTGSGFWSKRKNNEYGEKELPGHGKVEGKGGAEIEGVGF